MSTRRTFIKQASILSTGAISGFCILLIIGGCGNPGTSKNAKETSARDTIPFYSAGKAVENISIETSKDEGADLIVKNDCRTCHREHEKLIGPSFADIATKYKQQDLGFLSNKIIKGGSGSWGNVPMTAHPGLTKMEADKIIKFILKYKK